MNTTYRSKFNEDTQTWVAVSEIAASKTKGSASLKLKPIVIALTAVTALLFQAKSAYANGVFTNGSGIIISPTGAGAVPATTFNGNIGSISIGNNADAGDNAVAVGPNAVAPGQYAAAFGPSAWAQATRAIAIGANVNVDATAVAAIAVGSSSSASVTNAMALGPNSLATQIGGVALGEGAKAIAAATLTPSATINGVTYSGFAGATATRVLAIGSSATDTRQINFVSAGKINSTSTDAINGSQLFGVAASLQSSIASISTGHYVSINDGGTIGGNYTNNGATGVNAVAIGVGATATGTSAIAIGRNASAFGASAYALGENSKATGQNSVTLGADTQTTTQYAAAIGRAASASGQSAVAIGGGALNGGAASASGTSAIAIGGGGSTTDGSKAIGKYSIAIGSASTASLDDSIALGKSATALANIGDIALGSNSKTATVVNTTSATVNGVSYGGFAGTDATSTVSIGSGVAVNGVRCSSHDFI